MHDGFWGMRWLGGVGLALGLLAFCSIAAAEDSPADNSAGVLAAVQAAVSRGHVERTRVLGYSLAKVPFSEVPSAGALLVGFELGLGKFTNGEVIYALRPLYLAQHGEVTSPGYGLFADKALH